MHRQSYHNQLDHNQPAIAWSGLKQRLIYLPGAVVLIYGFWLTLTV